MACDYDPENAAHRQQLAFDLTDAVIGAGFQREANTVIRHGQKIEGEMVYAQPVQGHPDLRIVVFTSIIRGQVRKAAKDAIRVSAVYTAKCDGKDRGVIKSVRVHRTGAIERIIDRCLNRIATVQGLVDVIACCEHCGAPKFQSKNKNWVCAELCWKQNAQSPAQAQAKSQPQTNHGTCPHCGAPRALSKNHKLYCTALCWKKKRPRRY